MRQLKLFTILVTLPDNKSCHSPISSVWLGWPHPHSHTSCTAMSVPPLRLSCPCGRTYLFLPLHACACVCTHIHVISPSTTLQDLGWLFVILSYSFDIIVNLGLQEAWLCSRFHHTTGSRTLVFSIFFFFLWNNNNNPFRWMKFIKYLWKSSDKRINSMEWVLCNVTHAPNPFLHLILIYVCLPVCLERERHNVECIYIVSCFPMSSVTCI